ncbi:hypothetical protein P280DRAFT_548400 [Massarina eburnea CBS 473.64]|uniref:FAD-binding PCMH-type domain-containing protein n=1 Tax=Massarina eburnea CBS 473.64 TaxID=1395130 RepID=A0A6A6S5Q6_9PLEO|nr:hypothetical protein P280DRAFT_548400 [Massarina eburnea CBS 473.64]
MEDDSVGRWKYFADGVPGFREGLEARVVMMLTASSCQPNPSSLYHGSTLSTRSSRHKDVLTFNKTDKTVLVEPNVAMDGLFDRTIRRIEIIVGNGETVQASRENEHRDVFYACAGGCGSLGVITLLEMELVDAQPYVELEYRAVRSVQEAVEVCREVERLYGIASATKGLLGCHITCRGNWHGTKESATRISQIWDCMGRAPLWRSLERLGTNAW